MRLALQNDLHRQLDSVLLGVTGIENVMVTL